MVFNNGKFIENVWSHLSLFRHLSDSCLAACALSQCVGFICLTFCWLCLLGGGTRSVEWKKPSFVWGDSAHSIDSIFVSMGVEFDMVSANVWPLKDKPSPQATSFNQVMKWLDLLQLWSRLTCLDFFPQWLGTCLSLESCNVRLNLRLTVLVTCKYVTYFHLRLYLPFCVIWWYSTAFPVQSLMKTF